MASFSCISICLMLCLTSELPLKLNLITCLVYFGTVITSCFLFVILTVETTVCQRCQLSSEDLSYWLPDADKHHVLIYIEDHRTTKQGFTGDVIIEIDASLSNLGPTSHKHEVFCVFFAVSLALPCHVVQVKPPGSSDYLYLI